LASAPILVVSLGSTLLACSTGPVTTNSGAVARSRSGTVNSRGLGHLTHAELAIQSGVNAIAVDGAALGDQLSRIAIGPGSAHARVSTSTQGMVAVKQLGGGSEPSLRLTVLLSDRIPWAVDLGGGSTSATLDLNPLRLSSVAVTAGAERLETELPQPRAVVPVTLTGGATSVEITAPRAVPVQVSVPDGVSGVQLPIESSASAGGGVSGGHTFTVGSYLGASRAYKVDLDSGAGSLVVKEG
jgi:hypothetical protein